MARPKTTMTDVLKKAIAESGQSLIGIQRETGVNRISLIRFMRGETSIRLDVADKLAVYFGLELRAKRKGR
jgi:plasmid maintenance system antidote protein VapI